MFPALLYIYTTATNKISQEKKQVTDGWKMYTKS